MVRRSLPMRLRSVLLTRRTLVNGAACKPILPDRRDAEGHQRRGSTPNSGENSTPLIIKATTALSFSGHFILLTSGYAEQRFP
jgi:hypothetical protein